MEPLLTDILLGMIDGQGAEERFSQRMQAWAGQAAALARAEPAVEVVVRLWQEAETLLPSAC